MERGWKIKAEGKGVPRVGSESLANNYLVLYFVVDVDRWLLLFGCDVCRSHTDDREKVEQDRLSTERKLSELFRLLLLDSQYRDVNNVVIALDHIVNKVCDAVV